MKEIITLDGLRNLLNMEKKPKNWKALVINYLKKKEEILEKFPNDAWRVEVYKEAVYLARRLGIKWKMKKI